MKRIRTTRKHTIIAVCAAIPAIAAAILIPRAVRAKRLKRYANI